MSRKKTATIVESELIARLSLITGHHKAIVRDIIKAQTEFVLDEISCGTPVRIGNLGEICTITYVGRGGVNMRTNEPLPDKTITRIKFRPSTALRAAVKKLAESMEGQEDG